MTTKADLRKIGEGYLAKERANDLKIQINNAVREIIAAAEKERTTCIYNLAVYVKDTEFCNEFLNGVKAEFPDIDVSVSPIAITMSYEFSWKD
jgi:hypothetical protein